jgi:hypothetical protein
MKANNIIKICLIALIMGLLVYAIAFAQNCGDCKGWYYDKETDKFKTQFCAIDSDPVELKGQCLKSTCTYYCKRMNNKDQWFKVSCTPNPEPCKDIPQKENPFK